MKREKLSVVVLIVVVLMGACLNLPRVCLAGADERILSFDSHIIIHEDSSMTVRETIRVLSSGSEIKRGIYRDFPTRYANKFGNRVTVDFNVVEILRDGRPESYHLKDLDNGERVYIGKEDVFLNPGEYTYTITYRTNRQIGFFKDHDELYWNVTGNGWVFPIDKASATVQLPEGGTGTVLSVEGYTGAQGSKARNFSTSVDASGNVQFLTTRPLGSYEGLTIVVSWPKGLVSAPTTGAQLRYFLKDNGSTVAGIAALFIILGYYGITWSFFGKDPEKGTVIPLYSPPQGFSPSAMRYIEKMGYDQKTFAAAVINMAVKGFLSIREKDDSYVLVRNRIDQDALTTEEKKIADKLFSAGSEIELKSANHEIISRSLSALKDSLTLSYEKIYFLTNTRYFVPGVLLSVVLIVASVLLGRKTDLGVFLSVWLTVWSLGVVFLLFVVIGRWKEAIHERKDKPSSLGGVIILSLFSLPFLMGEGFGLYALADQTSVWLIVVLLLLVFINYLFYHLLKAPTRAGANVMSQFEGFKMFLSVTEKDRLNLINPPEKTPALFEKYLPYALALDVEQAWAEQFSGILSHAGEEGVTYSPHWYSGSSWSAASMSNFTESLGSTFAGAIASSATAPGSSSGGGGGGSSGGGGGGGGGGGW